MLPRFFLNWPRWHARRPDCIPDPGAPTWWDSSVGGPLLWLADEPWPHCEGPHVVDGVNPALSPADVRLERGYRQQLYVCPAAPEHPHIELMT